MKKSLTVVRNLFVLLLILSALLGVVACQEGLDDGDAVAEAGQGKLSAMELMFRLPPPVDEEGGDSGYTKAEITNTISRWVDEEVMVQEAMKRGLDTKPEVQFLIRSATRKILVDQLYLEIKSQMKEPRDGEILEYYESNRTDFLRTYPLYKVSYITTSNGKQAWKWKDQLNKRVRFDKFKKLVHKWVPQAEDPDGWIQQEEIPECLHGDLKRLKPGQQTRPRKCDSLYYIMQLVDYSPAGEPFKLIEVKKQVIQKLQQHKLKSAIEHLQDSLKAGTAIFTNLENLKTEANPGAQASEPQVQESNPEADSLGNSAEGAKADAGEQKTSSSVSPSPSASTPKKKASTNSYPKREKKKQAKPVQASIQKTQKKSVSTAKPKVVEPATPAAAPTPAPTPEPQPQPNAAEKEASAPAPQSAPEPTPAPKPAPAAEVKAEPAPPTPKVQAAPPAANPATPAAEASPAATP